MRKPKFFGSVNIPKRDHKYIVTIYRCAKHRFEFKAYIDGNLYRHSLIVTNDKEAAWEKATVLCHKIARYQLA